MKWLAFDIGGANLKAADGDGFAVVEPFLLWQKPEQLAPALRAMVAMVPAVDHLAVTMTGELADCFRTKREGVCSVLDAVERAADGRHTRIYLTDGRLVTPAVARAHPLAAAASNWHALATFAGRLVPSGTALLVDIGTTTCDVVPLVDGLPAAAGHNDPERMSHGELVYTGVERSPLCAVLAETSWQGRPLPLAHEMFATMWDVYITLGDLVEEPDSVHTADGRAATKEAALDRLARSVCADREMFSASDARELAARAAAAQMEIIAKAMRQVVDRAGRPACVVVSGRGEWLAHRVLDELGLSSQRISLAEQLGPEISIAATAHALAVLARGPA